MKVAVAGSGEWLGGHIARGLTDAGHDVVDAPGPAGGTLVHAASLIESRPADRRDYDRVNVEELGTVLDQLVPGGGRMIYLASYLVLPPSGTDGMIEDDTPLRDPELHRDDQRSLWVGDQLVRFRQTQGQAIVRLYPGVLYGPGLAVPPSLTAGNAWRSFTFVGDVVQAVVALACRDEWPEALVLGGDNRRVADWSRAVEQATGARLRRSRLGSLWTRLTGGVPSWTRGDAALQRYHWRLGSLAAEATIGYGVTSIEDGLGHGLAEEDGG